MPIRVHDRDFHILTELGEVGIMDTPMVHARHFPDDKTGEACRRRLRLYAQNDLILTTPQPLSYGSAGGRPRCVHRLTPFGADTVHGRTGVLPSRVARADGLRADTIQHRLGLAGVHLAVLDACKQQGLPAPKWILEQDTNPQASPEARFTERFVLYELFRAPDNSTISCRPDASTWLRIPADAATAGAQKFLELLVYWEFDRSTETLARIARKLPGYRQLLQTGAFRKHWPGVANPSVRIFFVVPSQERLQNIAFAIRSLPGSDAVRLAVRSALTPAQLLTEPIWETVTGDKRRLWTPGQPTSAPRGPHVSVPVR